MTRKSAATKVLFSTTAQTLLYAEVEKLSSTVAQKHRSSSTTDVLASFEFAPASSIQNPTQDIKFTRASAQITITNCKSNFTKMQGSEESL